MAAWPSGKAEACKAFIPSSNPGAAFLYLQEIMIVKILAVATPFPSLHTKSIVPAPAVTKISKKQSLIEPPVPMVANPFVKKFARIASRFS